MSNAGTQKSDLVCSVCYHRWTTNTLTNVAINVWTEHLKSLYCPKCGANWRKLSFATGKLSAEVEGAPK